MNTPDTEWREDFRNKILDIETAIRLTYNEKDSDSMVAKMTDYIANLLTSRDTYWKERVRKEVESKDGAYHERGMLVCALSKLFPSYLARHSEEDTEWENDWRWIVYIDIPTETMLLPTGNEITRSSQVSWHIHDSERDLFNHLEVKENNWDGHNTERKYQRLQALKVLTPHPDVPPNQQTP